MTRIEEAVWAAAYVASLGRMVGTQVDQHNRAVPEADFTVLAMRRACGYAGGRLHKDDVLENERIESKRTSGSENEREMKP